MEKPVQEMTRQELWSELRSLLATEPTPRRIRLFFNRVFSIHSPFHGEHLPFMKYVAINTGLYFCFTNIVPEENPYCFSPLKTEPNENWRVRVFPDGSVVVLEGTPEELNAEFPLP